jgi:pimeloyl-ACP methyl ester carboxylesterase
MMSAILPLSDGGRVRILSAGDGPPVLLIHGVGLRAEVWGPQMQALAATHQVLAVDMPGHGDSDPLPPLASLPDFVAWAARVIGGLALGPVAIAGHSMGALIAGGLAMTRPDLVARVALLCPVHRRDAAARAAVLARATDIAAGKGDAEAPLARWFTAEEPAPRALCAEMLRNVNPSGYATAYAAFAAGDATYADRLTDIRCPTLVLTAEGDANSTPVMTYAIAAAIPGAAALVIAGHRHMLTLTAADQVNAALLDWLKERPE